MREKWDTEPRRPIECGGFSAADSLAELAVKIANPYQPRGPCRPAR